jgi:hypothetical protein
MSYEAEISRTNPTCFVFLVDHSTSMQNPIQGEAGNPKKSEFVAESINKVLQSLIVSASKDLDIRRYFQIAILGYGFEVKSAFKGALADRELLWIDEVYENPLRLEDRIREEDLGEEGVVELTTRYPIWIEAEAKGQTPMCAAMNRAIEILTPWVEEHPDSYPPTVINLTDGESNDGDVRIPANELKQLHTNDGNVILLTVHASSNSFAEKVFFPDTEQNLPDHFSKTMFTMSSILTPNMKRTSSEILGIELGDSARGMVYNGDIASIVQALEIGTRPANLA